MWHISQVEQVRIQQISSKHTHFEVFFELDLGRNAEVLSGQLIKLRMTGLSRSRKYAPDLLDVRYLGQRSHSVPTLLYSLAAPSTCVPVVRVSPVEVPRAVSPTASAPTPVPES